MHCTYAIIANYNELDKLRAKMLMNATSESFGYHHNNNYAGGSSLLVDWLKGLFLVDSWDVCTDGTYWTAIRCCVVDGAWKNHWLTTNISMLYIVADTTAEHKSVGQLWRRQLITWRQEFTVQ